MQIATGTNVIILMPVYEDAASSEILFAALKEELKEGFFVVAVDDGSIVSPPDLRSMEKAGVQGAIIRLTRNLGHQCAIAHGLSVIAETMEDHQRVIIMDSDGEDMPSSISVLLASLAASEVDIATAKRMSRHDSRLVRLFYHFYRGFFRIMTGYSLTFGNFMALKAHAVRRLVAMHETTTHVASSVLASKLRVKPCPIDKGPRYAGQSKMNFVNLALHGFKAMMNFSDQVLVRVGIICSVIAALSLLAMGLAVLLKLTGMSPPGWFSVIIAVLLMIFIQTGALTLIMLLLSGSTGPKLPPTAKQYRSQILGIEETSRGLA